MVHAMLELDVNCDGNVALNILNYAKSTLPFGKHIVEFSKLYARALSFLRRHDELRDYFESILSTTDENSRGGGKSSEEQLLLWQTYLQCMTQANVCDVDTQHTIVEKISQLMEAASGLKAEDRWVLYEFDLGIYNNAWMSATLPTTEQSFVQRSRLRMPYDATNAERSNAQSKVNNQDKTAAPSASLAPSIRSFLSRLPPHSGVVPDVSSYMETLRKTILPPRPVESSGQGSTMKRKIDDVLVDDDKKISDGNHKNLFTSRQRMKL